MPTSFRVQPPPPSHVGDLVPADTPHAVSVALPTWQDNVDYEEGEQRVKDAMTSGYPRFFIHHRIQALADLACAKFGQPDELCILLPTESTARGCSSFLSSRSPPVHSRITSWPIHAVSSSSPTDSTPSASAATRTITVWACFFPSSDFPAAKQYWQHTGEGISSRVAERCLILLGEIEADANGATGGAGASPTQATPSQAGPGQEGATRFFVNGGGNGPVNGGRYASSKSRYQVAKGSATTPPVAAGIEVARPTVSSKLRYSTSKARATNGGDSGEATPSSSEADSLANSIEQLSMPSASSSRRPSQDAASSPLPTPATPLLATTNGTSLVEQDEDVLARYVEERYGRNLDLSLAPLAKLAMRRRIAGVLREGPGEAIPVQDMTGAKREESTRGVTGLTEDDVWLYSCGMNAIFHAHQVAMEAWKREGREVGKSVCFGFPYTDTLKILEKWGPGCHFFGRGLTSDLPSLRQTLQQSSPPILALFCEFPSNPLLRSPPLHELRKLADEFGFLIVVDETIAGFVNVEVLPLADIVVSSLTKVFSGDSNVMGGSLVLNPKAPHYAALKAAQEATYEDAYFDEDAIYMERNSRDFQARVAQENSNAEMLCNYLRSRRVPGPAATGVIDEPKQEELANGAETSEFVVTEVYYPKYMTPEHYLASLRPPNPSLGPKSSGFGALFSLTFSSILASRTFFDALPCYKGPSLGTNFTLACPYTILAHYTELEWAKEWGVEKGLVRISTGLEEPEMLRQWFEEALEKAERAVRQAKERGETVV
ncbi:putative cystathionine gamma-synthase [Rhodotorula toruloides]|nr:putative cystathionine gamma-synthase [Rhodotorula toruloides]